MILRLAQYGLIHGDFNEFNILIKEEKLSSKNPEAITLTPVLIDFPQMVSIDHANAEFYFDRDVNCIKRFFERRFHFTSNENGPFFSSARKLIGKDGIKRLDVSVEASGFSRKMAKELETYMKAVGVDGDGEPGAKRGDEEYDEEGSEEEDEEDEEEDIHTTPEELSGKQKSHDEETEGISKASGNVDGVLSIAGLKIDDKT
jgi:RIO kinase 2